MAPGTVGPKNWGDRPVYIVGGGPSLKPFVDRLPNLHEKGYVLAVNDGFRFCKPDAVLSMDQTWFANRLQEIPTLPFHFYLATKPTEEGPEIPNLTYLHHVPRAKKVQLSVEDGIITNGLNSGFCALNFAFLKGAKEIFLLGFDFNAPKGVDHFHKGYEWYSPSNTGRLFPIWAAMFEDVAPQLETAGVKVWNCSNNSLIKSFAYKSYEEAL